VVVVSRNRIMSIASMAFIAKGRVSAPPTPDSMVDDQGEGGREAG
jgi:hypothetical protein